MPDVRTIHVFIASPGDLPVERRAFKDVIDGLNSGFGDGAGVKFVPLGWEDTLATTGRRSQSVINKEIDRCDVFVLALHRRWGQEAPDAKPYTSYTEEEFHRALNRWKNTGTPEIFVFFKHADAASMADPGEQLKKVLAFRKSLEESRKVLYRTRGDLEQAEEMQKKALGINEKLGHQEGMAANYGNLGLIAKDRGNFETARELWCKDRELYSKIGIPHEVQKIEGWLSSLPQRK